MKQQRSLNRREQIVRFVESFYEANHRSPSIRELSAGTGIPTTPISRSLNEMSELGILYYDGSEIVTEKIAKSHRECCYAGMLGSISCGPLRMEEEEAESFYPLPEELFGSGPLYLLRASGDSMTGAGIHDGDLIVIRKTEEPQENQIVVAWVEGEGNTLKRLKRNADGMLVLHPENPEYQDIPAENARIQGVAVKVISDL